MQPRLEHRSLAASGRMDAAAGASLLKRSAVAMIDQGLLSGLNLLVTVILIKTVSKAEYGYYSVAFAVTLFIISIQNAVSTTPLTVLLVTMDAARRRDYARSLCWGQLLVLVPATGLGLGAVGTLYALGLDSTKALIAGSLCLASTGVLLREFSRSYFYAEETPADVLRLDLYYAVFYLGLIAAAFLLFTISAALVIVFGGLSAGIVFALFHRRVPPSFNLGLIRESYRENWKYGRWSLLGVVITHIQKHSYLYFLGALLGSMAVADASAARVLMMPFVLLQAGWGKVTVPHGSRMREERRLGRYYKELVLISVGIGCAVFLYVCLIRIVWGPLSTLLYTDKYQDVFDYVPLWGAINAVMCIRMNAGFGLQVIKRFDSIAKINAMTMIVTVLSTYILIPSYGIEGALLSLLLGEIMLAAILWGILTVRVRSGPPAPA